MSLIQSICFSNQQQQSLCRFLLESFRATLHSSFFSKLFLVDRNELLLSVRIHSCMLQFMGSLNSAHCYRVSRLNKMHIFHLTLYSYDTQTLLLCSSDTYDAYAFSYRRQIFLLNIRLFPRRVLKDTNCMTCWRLQAAQIWLQMLTLIIWGRWLEKQWSALDPSHRECFLRTWALTHACRSGQNITHSIMYYTWILSNTYCK